MRFILLVAVICLAVAREVLTQDTGKRDTEQLLGAVDDKLSFCNGIDLRELTVSKTKELVKAGKLTSEQLAQCFLARIDAMDTDLESVSGIKSDSIGDEQDDQVELNSTNRKGLSAKSITVSGQININCIGATAGRACERNCKQTKGNGWTGGCVWGSCRCSNDPVDVRCGMDGSFLGIRCPDRSACQRKCCREGRNGKCKGFFWTKCKCY